MRSYILSTQAEGTILKTIAITDNLEEAETIVKSLEATGVSNQRRYKIINTSLFQSQKKSEHAASIDNYESMLDEESREFCRELEKIFFLSMIGMKK